MQVVILRECVVLKREQPRFRRRMYVIFDKQHLAAGAENLSCWKRCRSPRNLLGPFVPELFPLKNGDASCGYQKFNQFT